MITFLVTLFIILALIFLVPIPFKLFLSISRDRYLIKFYNIVILSNNGGIIRKFLDKKKSNCENKTKKKEKKKKSMNSKKYKNSFKKNKSKNKKLSFKKLYFYLRKNKFKPSLKFENNVNYSLNDASITAILMGLLYNLNPIFIFLFSIIFNIKRFKSDFTPNFKNEFVIELTISSIITFNLAQIIYMLYLVFKSMVKVEEVTP